MKPRERVLAALAHRETDRVPRFEIWIDALLDELGQADAPAAYAGLGQDGVLLPTRTPPESNAWRNGVDEWGRVWQAGMYVSGVVETKADLSRYSPPASYAAELFDADAARQVRERYPDHCLLYGSHIGPLTAGYMAMGFESFSLRLMDDPAFIHLLFERRTDWCLALFQEAVRLGANLLVLGDDAGYRSGPMISPRMWRKLVLPYHRRIVDSVEVPVLWHSDGNVEALLPMAIEAGFAGIHGLEPAAGMDLARIKREYGRDLALVGNIDVQVLCGDDLAAVRREVDRCIAEGAPGGGYMLATCNSIFNGMSARAVAEMFRYAAEVGVYS
jgi:uroporphyrinogen decarboxylase